MKQYNKKRMTRKIEAAVLAIALTIGGIFSGGTDSFAASNWQTEFSTNGMVTVASDKGFEATVTLKDYGTITWSTKLKSLFSYTLTLTDSAGRQVEEKRVEDSDTSWYQVKENGVYVYRRTDSFKGNKAGTYKVQVKFDGSSDVEASFTARTDTSSGVPTIKDEEIVAGFTTTLTVSGDTIQKCVSSKKNVATVTAKGVVTGKKAGETTITVSTEKGLTLTCNVTVKANAWSAAKITKNDVNPGGYNIKPYQVKYDAKGNLVIKAKAINNGTQKVKIRVWTRNFKNMGDKKKMITVTLPKKCDKSVTLKFKKAVLVKERVDLTSSGIQLYMQKC